MGDGACRNDCPFMFYPRLYRLVDITALQPLEFIKLPFAVILAWLILANGPAFGHGLAGQLFLPRPSISLGVRPTPKNRFGQMPEPARPNYSPYENTAKRGEIKNVSPHQASLFSSILNRPVKRRATIKNRQRSIRRRAAFRIDDWHILFDQSDPVFINR